jgi:hypothetical protein
MAVDELRGVLDPIPPLEGRLGDARPLRGHGEHDRQRHDDRADAAEPLKGETPPAASDQPPIVPDHVFLGLTLGQNLGPPISRPAK